jgi:hypothetical protein
MSKYGDAEISIKSYYILSKSEISPPTLMWKKIMFTVLLYILNRYFANYNYNIQKHSVFILPVVQIPQTPLQIHLNAK